MEHVNGYLAEDGKFFHSEEECRAYEGSLECEIRRKAVIKCFREGEYLSGNSTSLPKDLRDHFAAISEDDLTELWNQHLLPLFLLEQEGTARSVLHEMPEIGGSRSTTDPVEFFVMKSEAAHKLLAFVLGKSY